MPANRPPEAPQPARQFNVEVPSNLELVYSNFAIINHAPSEVMIDFGQLMPNTPQQIRVRARVMLTPMNAKLLLRALSENLVNYERRFGEIKTPQDFDPSQGFLGGVQWKVGNEPGEPGEE